MITRLVAYASALLCGFTMAADVSNFSPRGKPAIVCNNTQANLRFMYVARANGSSETYDGIKGEMRASLQGSEDKERKLRNVYEAMIKRIEMGEFSPPKMERGEGALAVRDAAAALCAAALM
jgi:hypothetical protein